MRRPARAVLGAASMIVLLLAAVLAASPSTAAVPPRTDAAAEALRAAERDALRALASVALGEPGILEVQDAAARVAERAVVAAGGFARRARLAALLPRVTAEYQRDERSYRVVGLQAAGEVDYRRLAPDSALVFRATWELGELVAAPGELAAASADAERARRRAEAVKRATALFYERRRARLSLLLEPSDEPLARAEEELAVDRLGAELDALTGGLLSGRSR
ncbi:MAG TPA: hypothetical protein VF894_01600 [Anaeromyxobacter sp.]